MEVRWWCFLLPTPHAGRHFNGVTKPTSSIALFHNFPSSPWQPKVKSRGRVFLPLWPSLVSLRCLFWQSLLSLRPPDIVEHSGPASEVQKDLSLLDLAPRKPLGPSHVSHVSTDKYQNYIHQPPQQGKCSKAGECRDFWLTLLKS